VGLTFHLITVCNPLGFDFTELKQNSGVISRRSTCITNFKSFKLLKALQKSRVAIIFQKCSITFKPEEWASVFNNLEQLYNS
jgi:hypothetical protein